MFDESCALYVKSMRLCVVSKLCLSPVSLFSDFVNSNNKPYGDNNEEVNGAPIVVTAALCLSH